ncbi:ABC transporter permease subunit [Aquamicrobium ahrensii]|uniref:General L-amino acid transport system permease protein n=1 Tax=Aquamicrobium ahrensii TaxID=469551 RepID=A0ABV2KG55_9HYPH
MTSFPARSNSRVHRIGFLIFLALLAVLLQPFFRWALLDASWSGDAETCRAGAGACWASVRLRLEFLIYGFYPAELRWRPFTGLIIQGLALLAIWALPGIHQRLSRSYCVVLAAFVASFWLLAGDGLLLTDVPSRLWTGFSLTVLLAFGGFVLAFPLGVLLAFGRRFGNDYVVALCGCYIEVMRALPSVVTMFAILVIAPYLLPSVIGENIFLRILLGFVLAMSAFYAEALRGALLTLDKGQIEAAQSLGLRRFSIHCRIILPQVVILSFPALMNINLMVFKDTVLILTYGYYELLGAANASVNTQEWSSFAMEMFLVVYLVFLGAGMLISVVGRRIEESRQRV